MKRGFILVVDDEAEIRLSVEQTLLDAGYEVATEVDGRAGMESAIKVDYDLLILDIGLPYNNGLTILEAVRAVRPTAPVIIMTAEDTEDARVRGLEMGADDYVVKPFSLREMAARVEAVLRRSPERPTDVDHIAIPGGRVELGNGRVIFEDGETSGLSPRELDFLAYVVRNAGRVISREEILTRVYRINPRAVVGTRTIDMLAVRVRKRIRDEEAPHFVQTVRGKGYLVETTSATAP
jgi:DNA-binding response OmpR family regulator